MASPVARFRVSHRGARLADTEWTDMLIPLARDVGLFIAEASTCDEVVNNHLSLKTLEAHLAEIRTQAAHF